MRKDSTNIIPACLVDSVHYAIVSKYLSLIAMMHVILKGNQATNCDDHSVANNEIQVFENDT